MRSSSNFPFLRSLPGACLLVLGTLACADRWGEVHKGALTMAERPECPTDWGDSIPWFKFDTTETEKRLGALPTVFAAGYRAIPGGVPGSEASTDIPEFNDCQRFVTPDEQNYDSLFAIFAGSKQDSISRALPFDDVQWKSSNQNVATVSPAGMVQGVAPGTAEITARSQLNPAVIASRIVKVMANIPRTTLGIDLGETGVDSIAVQDQRQAISPLGVPTDSSLAVATIYSYGQFYPSLGIEPNFNCVYLYFSQARTLSARVIPARQLPNSVNACKSKVDLGQQTGITLPVVRRVIAGLDAKVGEYPAVARWDWFPTEKRQYIGLGCGNAWCDIGVGNPPSPFIMPPGTQVGDQRVVSIKGWNDEQVLAVPNAAGKLVPSTLRATVIPFPDLRTQPWTKDARAEWRTAAYIAVKDLAGGDPPSTLQYYQDHLNIDLAPLGPLKEMNEMAYCYGRFWSCGSVSLQLILTAAKCDPKATFGKRWWVRITPAPGSSRSPEIYCITRRVHDATGRIATFSIPSTSRWRWFLGDDTVWTECVQGCCETRGGW